MDSPPKMFMGVPGRARDVVEHVQKTYRDMHKGKQSGHEVALYLAAPFGTYRCHSLFAHSEHLLGMNIQPDEGYHDILYCPVEMAAFQLRHYVPVNAEDKVLVGFGGIQT